MDTEDISKRSEEIDRITAGGLKSESAAAFLSLPIRVHP
jgi:hypothetical protein